MTLLTLLHILTFAKFATEAARVICPNEPIEAEIGEDVRLPCLLDPGLDLSDRTVDWTKVNDSEVVFSYRSRMINDIDQYRNRTRLSREDLSVGNMELQMFSAQLSDSGRYRCSVPQLRLSCTTSLTVVNKGQRNRTKTDDFSTSAPPLEEPPSPGRSHIPAILIPIAAAVVVGVCGLVVWTKCEKIRHYRLICQTPPIKAAAGDRAVIECHMDPPVHLKTTTVEFSKVDPYEVVLVHRSGEVDPDQSSSRISLSDEDLKRGIVRLQISPVQLSDSGLYKICIPQLKTHCTFDLSVAEKENLKQNRINTQDVNTIPETEPKKPGEDL